METDGRGGTIVQATHRSRFLENQISGGRAGGTEVLSPFSHPVF